jgi:hypothetical protein
VHENNTLSINIEFFLQRGEKSISEGIDAEAMG